MAANARALVMQPLWRIWVACLLAVLPAGAISAELVDGVVAVVEGRPVLISDLRNLQADLRRQGEPAESWADLRERRIEDLLVNRRADELGLAVTDKDVQDAIERIAGQNGMPVDELLRTVAAQGLEELEYRRVLRQQLLRVRISQREIEPRVRVDRADLVAWMRRHADRYGATPRARLWMGMFSDAALTRLLPDCAPPAACLDRSLGPDTLSAEPDLSPVEIPWNELDGDLQRWLSQDPEPGAFWVKAAPEPGAWILLRFVGLEAGDMQPLAEVEAEVFEAVRREKLDQAFLRWLDELKGAAWVERFPLPDGRP